MKLFDLIWLEAATKRDVTSVPSTGHLEYWVDRRRTGSYEIRISTPMFRSAFIYIYTYIYPVHFVSARWTPPETRPTFHRSLVPLARSLDPSPYRQVDDGKCCVSSNFVARNRIMRPCIVINQWARKGEIWRSRSERLIPRFWRRRVFISVTFVCKQYCLQCCIHDVSKKILFYYRLIENWLMKRLSGRGSNWTFMRNISLILIKISKLFNG